MVRSHHKTQTQTETQIKMGSIVTNSSVSESVSVSVSISVNAPLTTESGQTILLLWCSRSQLRLNDIAFVSGCREIT